MGLWFTEKHTEHAGITLQIKESLFSGKSDFQCIDILDTYEYGRMLVLDGLIMATERDEFVYHEMIAHPALFIHPDPKQVLVIGGGDGGTIREVIRHPGVEKALLCEYDKLVIDKAIEFLPSMASEIDGSNPKVEIQINDGMGCIMENSGRFDVILVDSTDPVDPETSLLEDIFYRTAHAALKEDGLLVVQSESPFQHAEVQKQMFDNLRKAFPIVEMYQAFVPTYPSGYWSFAFASKQYHPLTDFNPERAANRTFHTCYYNEELHRGAFMLPSFARENIAEKRNEPR